ncbi:hypothetical protein [Methylobacterium oxalidis]|uniref:hypothetical protein n=1 Tax=Methylobacterium oxalidis TaxID=944322 RepID=UPI00331598BC
MPAMNAQLAGLADFELPKEFVEPMLRALRLVNTALDGAFYDVGVLGMEALWRGTVVSSRPPRSVAGLIAAKPPIPRPAFSPVDLSALFNPEGCILLIDAGRAVFRRFDSADGVIAFASRPEGAAIDAVTVAGVGSSALGAAAFAWNASMALGRPVLAIVPGYGLADAVNQALGGWFGFGVYDWIASATQQALATTAPGLSRLGNNLLATVPNPAANSSGGLEFRTGSAASDVLHALLQEVPTITALLGRSKGALAIKNALRSLDEKTTSRLHVATFGCPIPTTAKVARYQQFLGIFDALGALNAWGNWPDHRIPTHHSTNTMIPFGMMVALLSRLALSDWDADGGLAAGDGAADDHGSEHQTATGTGTS